MKLPASLVFASVFVLVFALACETTPAADAQPAASASAAAAVGHKKFSEIPAHAGITMTPDSRSYTMSPELAASIEHRSEAAANAPPAVPAPKTDWNAKCLATRGCPTKSAEIPDCAPDKRAPTWTDVSSDAEKLLGKVIEVQGAIGLSGGGPRTGTCAPNDCCHALKFGMLIDGLPDALFLPGMTCSGDDSKICCKVPADGQVVVARGMLQRASAGAGILKWQLDKVALCIPDLSPKH
jgi:hypothetical protein